MEYNVKNLLINFYIKDITHKIPFKTDNPEVCNFGIQISHKLIQSGCKTIQYCLKTKLTIKNVFFVNKKVIFNKK